MIGYCTIDFALRKSLSVNNDEYIVLNLIYALCTNPEAPVPGMCTSANAKLAQMIDVHPKKLQRHLREMRDRGYIWMSPSGKDKRTTSEYNQLRLAILSGKKRQKSDVPTGQNCPSEVDKSVHPTGQKCPLILDKSVHDKWTELSMSINGRKEYLKEYLKEYTKTQARVRSLFLSVEALFDFSAKNLDAAAARVEYVDAVLAGREPSGDIASNYLQYCTKLIQGNVGAVDRVHPEQKIANLAQIANKSWGRREKSPRVAGEVGQWMLYIADEYSDDDVQLVCDYKIWQTTRMRFDNTPEFARQFLRFKTVFNPDNFSGYLEAARDDQAFLSYRQVAGSKSEPKKSAI